MGTVSLASSVDNSRDKLSFLYMHDQDLISPGLRFRNAMELKSGITAIFFLFLLFSVPYVSRGGSELDMEVYEIDYRGPETHSSTPPHGHAHGEVLNRRRSSFASHKSKGARGGKSGEKAKKIGG